MYRQGAGPASASPNTRPGWPRASQAGRPFRCFQLLLGRRPPSQLSAQAAAGPPGGLRCARQARRALGAGVPKRGCGHQLRTAPPWRSLRKTSGSGPGHSRLAQAARHRKNYLRTTASYKAPSRAPELRDIAEVDELLLEDLARRGLGSRLRAQARALACRANF